MTQSDLALEQLGILSDAVARVVRNVQTGADLCMADAKLIRGNAEWLEMLVSKASIERLEAMRAVTPEQDKAANLAMARAQNDRADAKGAA